MPKKATKQETELRVSHAPELVSEGKPIHLLLPLLSQNIEFQGEEPGRKSLLMVIFC